MGRFYGTNTVDIENTSRNTPITARGIRIGGHPQRNDINSGQIHNSDDTSALKIIGACASQRRQVYIDRTTTICDNLMVRCICDFAILNENVVGANLLNIIQDTTRKEIDASTRFIDYEPLINESTTISAGMSSTKDYAVWHVHAPLGATRVSVRGIQLGNQTNPEYDRASGSVTAPEYEVGTLCMVGIGAVGTHRIRCWATGGLCVVGSVTADDYVNWLDVDNAKYSNLLRRINVNTYTRNDQERLRDKPRIGFIAQDIHASVSNAMPDVKKLVDTSGERDSMNYGRLVCTLWGCC